MHPYLPVIGTSPFLLPKVLSQFTYAVMNIRVGQIEEKKKKELNTIFTLSTTTFSSPIFVLAVKRLSVFARTKFGCRSSGLQLLTNLGTIHMLVPFEYHCTNKYSRMKYELVLLQ